MRARHVHFFIFCIVVMLAPLPLGANRPFAWTMLAVAIAVLAVVWPGAILRERHAPVSPMAPLLIPALAFAMALGWGLVQTATGMPPSLWSPHWWEAAKALGVEPDSIGRIGLAPSAGAAGLIRLACYALVFWLAYQHAASRRRAGQMIDALALCGGVYALYGIFAHFLGTDSILWMDKWAYREALTSTFVNRNSYATFAGLGLLCALAAAARRLEGTVGGWRHLILHIHRPTALYLAAALVIAIALSATGSRAGVAASLAGCGVFILCLVVPRLHPALRLAGAVLVIAALGLGAALPFFMDQIDAGSDAADRLRVYRIVIGLIAERPWLGHGLGSFPDVFAMARPVAVSQVWLQAHNLYLELAMELGIPAAALLVLSVAGLLVMSAIPVFRSSRNRVHGALGCAATLLVAAHSTLDFSLQIPAVTITWAAVIGTAAGRAMAEGKRRSDPAASAGLQEANPGPLQHHGG